MLNCTSERSFPSSKQGGDLLRIHVILQPRRLREELDTSFAFVESAQSGRSINRNSQLVHSEYVLDSLMDVLVVPLQVSETSKPRVAQDAGVGLLLRLCGRPESAHSEREQGKGIRRTGCLAFVSDGR